MFVENQAKENATRAEMENFVGGCKTVENRTVINKEESDKEARIKQSEKIKEVGNASFRAGNFLQAEEYYTSALLQYDKVNLNIFDQTCINFLLESYLLYQQSPSQIKARQVPSSS